MISKTEIGSASGFGKYMKEEQAQAEYYTGQTPPSEWQGKGAEIQGLLDREVTLDELTKQLEGKVVEVDKETGMLKDKTLESVRGDHKAGWDFTIAAPKSVSIESEVFGHKDVRAAHEAAAQKAMDYLEKEGAQTRINGETVNTGNLTYAKVQHSTSRAGDPQTHTHVVIANVTFDKDGKAYSLESKGIYELRTTADAVYKAELAMGLEKLGYQTEWDKSGNFEIKGYTKEQLDAFSKRSTEMDAALRAKGIDPETATSAQRQQAVLDTRKGKDHSENAVDHRAGWQKEAGVAGIKDEQRGAVQGRVTETERGFNAESAVKSAMNHITEREAAFKPRDLVKESLRFSEGKAGIDDINRAIRDQIKSGELIPRADGKMTTQTAINEQKFAAKHLSDGIGAHESVMTKTEFDKALAAFEAKKGFNLSDEQRNASRMILTKDDRFQGVQGLAGTGKTTMLEFIKEAAESKGWEVKGFSNGGAQADKMQAESGIKSTTTASHLINAEKQAKDAELAKKALDTYDKNKGVLGKEPNWKDLDKQVKAGTATREFDSQKRMFVTDKNGDTWTKKLYDKVTQTESKNLEHLGATKTTYAATDKGVFKSGAGNGGLIAEGAGKLKELYNDKLAGKSGDVNWAVNKVLNNAMQWEKCNPVEAAAARAQMANETAQMREKELSSLKAQSQTGGTNKTLQICDEASMSGQREFIGVIKAAEQAGARTVFLGDKLQHQSVEAGKAFENSQKSMPVAELGEASIRRQTNDQAKSTVSKIIEGKHEEATRALPTKQINSAQESVHDKYAGREDMSAREKAAMRAELKEASKVDNQAVIRALAKDYSAQDRAGRDKTIVITATNADRNAINNEIRSNLKAQGELQNGIKMTVLEKTGLTKEEAGRAVNYEKGQIVEFGGKDKSQGIEQGSRATVEKIDSRTNMVTAKLDNGKEVSFNPAKKETELYNKQEREFAAGDKVAFTKNDKTLDVKNGQTGNIEKIENGKMSVRMENGEKRELDMAKNNHIDHGYAVTSHKSQGQTVEKTMVHHNTEAGKHGDRETYVNDTRMKESTTIYTQDADKAAKQSGQVMDKESAILEKAPEQAKDSATSRESAQETSRDPAASRTGDTAEKSHDRAEAVIDREAAKPEAKQEPAQDKGAEQTKPESTQEKESRIADGLDVAGSKDAHDAAVRDYNSKGYDQHVRNAYGKAAQDFDKNFDPSKSENQPQQRDPADAELKAKEQGVSDGLGVKDAEKSHDVAVKEYDKNGYDKEAYDKFGEQFEKEFGAKSATTEKPEAEQASKPEAQPQQARDPLEEALKEGDKNRKEVEASKSESKSESKAEAKPAAEKSEKGGEKGEKKEAPKASKAKGEGMER